MGGDSEDVLRSFAPYLQSTSNDLVPIAGSSYECALTACTRKQRKDAEFSVDAGFPVLLRSRGRLAPPHVRSCKKSSVHLGDCLYTLHFEDVVLERENYKLMSRLLEGRVRRLEYDCFADPYERQGRKIIEV